MALQSFDTDGHMTWQCTCGTLCAAHVSHEEVVFHHTPGRPLHTRSVGLPRCACGTKTTLKVDFTPQELMAPNMIDRQGQPTTSHATAHRHMALAKHMEAAGKPMPVAPVPAPMPSVGQTEETMHSAFSALED